MESLEQNTYWDFRDGRKVVVGTMYCIGRNYADHAKEMGAAVPEEPVVFIKPPSAYVPNNSIIELPTFSTNVHHECEMVAVLGRRAHKVEASEALSYVAGIGVGLDLTLRDIQSKAKAKGEPWAVAKGFYQSAPVSDIVSVDQRTLDNGIDLSLFCNGQLRQKGNTRSMLFSLPNLIAYLSSVFVLVPGDAIFTGTPEGVSQIVSGDRLEARLGESVVLHVNIA